MSAWLLASCGATLNSSRRHVPGAVTAATAAADVPRQAVGGAAAFHRIPQQVAAGRPFREGSGKAISQPLELVLLLEGGSISTRPRRSFGGTKAGSAIQPSRSTTRAWVSRRSASIRRLRAGFDLAGHQPVLRPQQRTGDQRRAGIGLKIAPRIEGPDDIEIGSYQRQDGFRKPRLHDARDAGEPLAAAARFIAVRS